MIGMRTSPLVIVDSGTDDCKVPAKSTHSNRSIVKSGTSAAVNVTKEVAAMGLVIGDPVNIRLSHPSAKTDAHNTILDMVDNDDYSILNMKWIVKEDDSISITPDRVRRVASLKGLYSDVISVLIDYISRSCDGQVLRYDKDLNSFILTVPPGTNVNKPLYFKDQKDKLNVCVNNLIFLSDLAEEMGELESPLKCTGDVYTMITDAFMEGSIVYDSDNFEEELKKYNKIRDEKQAAMLEVEGDYVCYVFYRLEDDSKITFTNYIIRAFSKEDALNIMNDREVSKLEDDSDLQLEILRTVALGPFSYKDAVNFENYCDVGIQINFKTLQMDDTINWLIDQSESFKSRFQS